MSFLLGADYASSSESESDEDEVSMIQMLHDSDNERKRSKHILPSADSVLSSVSASTASFLPPKFSVTARSTVKCFNLLEGQETQRQKQKLQDSVQATQELEQKVATGKLKVGCKRRPPPDEATREPLFKRERKDAKERVKSQRLKGQAGIGSDFRGWKSETEMALRQQFD